MEVMTMLAALGVGEMTGGVLVAGDILATVGISMSIVEEDVTNTMLVVAV